MRVYTAISLPFLFLTSTISSKSLPVSFLGDSMTIFKAGQAKFSEAVTKAILHYFHVRERNPLML